MESMDKYIIYKRIQIYLFITLGIVFCLFILALLLPDNMGKLIYSFLLIIFTPLPLIATWATRKLTKDTSSWSINFKVWRNLRMWCFSAFVPTIAIFLGIIIYYCIFPDDLDFSGKYIVQTYSQYGAPEKIDLTISSMLFMGLILIFISAIAIPIQILELGEEIGWRGYLFPLLCKIMSVRKAILVNGLFWGIAHAPLIYFGFNYGLNYLGAPFLGIFMMIFVCIIFGVLECYVMYKTGNCMYSAIIHGAMNIIGETGVWVSLSSKSPLLGPNPTGIIGICVTVIVALLLMIILKSEIKIKIRGIKDERY